MTNTDGIKDNLHNRGIPNVMGTVYYTKMECGGHWCDLFYMYVILKPPSLSWHFLIKVFSLSVPQFELIPPILSKRSSLILLDVLVKSFPSLAGTLSYHLGGRNINAFFGWLFERKTCSVLSVYCPSLWRPVAEILSWVSAIAKMKSGGGALEIRLPFFLRHSDAAVRIWRFPSPQLLWNVLLSASVTWRKCLSQFFTCSLF